MGVLLLLVALIPAPPASERVLMDFSRLSKALGQEIALVERNGNLRQGRLVTTALDAATMEFASGSHVFSRDQIASVTRLKDSTKDGLIKGVIFGALLSLYVSGELGGDASNGMLLRTTATYGAIGWALDAARTNPQPIYRAPKPKQDPSVKLSLRF